MLQGSEYLTSNTGIAYPFVENAAGLVRDGGTHGATATLPSDVFVDASIITPYGNIRAYLYAIEALGGGVYGFVFRNHVSAVILYGTVTVGTVDPTKQFTRLLFLYSTTMGKFVVVTSKLLAYLAGVGGIPDVFGTNLQLEPSTLELNPKRIETLDIYTALPPIPAPNVPGTITGEVKLVAGYNMELVPTVDELTNVTTIELSAVAGSGQGLAPCPDPTPTIYKQFMTLTPDDAGNVQLAVGDDRCYAIIPYVDPIDPTKYYFAVHGTCLAGCECLDYRAVTRALGKLFDRSKVILDKLNTARADPVNGYEIGVTKYNSIIFPTYDMPVLSINGMGGAAWDNDPNKNGAPHFATLSIVVQNNTSWDMELTQLTLSLVTAPVGGTKLRQIVWECGGKGGELPLAFPINFSPAQSIARGQRFSVYVFMYHVDATVNPVWTATASGTVTVNPAGSPTYVHVFDPVVCTFS